MQNAEQGKQRIRGEILRRSAPQDDISARVSHSTTTTAISNQESEKTPLLGIRMFASQKIGIRGIPGDNTIFLEP
jgi:hypothetical protein